MQTRILQGRLADIDADIVVTPGFDAQMPHDDGLNDATGGWVGEIRLSGEFSGKPGELALLHRPQGLKTKRLAIAGAGARPNFTELEMRRLAGTVVRSLKGKAFRRISLLLPEDLATQSMVQAAVEGAVLGGFEPDQLKTDPKKNDSRIDEFNVVVPQIDAALEKAGADGAIIGEAQNFARELVNEPSNILPPMALADRARAMASEHGLQCEILDEARMREMGMGAFIGVAQGSDNPSAMIVLRYSPSSGLGSDHLGLIGKGVTFDTGGVSIKPSDGMEKMKYDMGGGAAVIGAMKALAQLRPHVRITAVIPAAENMVSGRAQRPGDVVTSMSGKTIEVLNTDAEGRLLLADAMTYAIREGCTHLVDAATLTGAIVVALGHIYIGAFSNDDDMLARVITAGKQTGERMWQMPLDDDYKDYLKTPFADLPNIGGRWGGSITAAKFIEEFVEKKPWVHLDIAGTAWLDDGKPFLSKGPTGVPLRSFVSLAMNWGRQS